MFTVDNNPQGNPQSNVKAVQKTTLNHIVKIASGTTHFLALKKVIRPPFKEWSNNMIVEWITKIGFDEFSSIFEKEIVTAEYLEELDHDEF